MTYLHVMNHDISFLQPRMSHATAQIIDQRRKGHPSKEWLCISLLDENGQSAIPIVLQKIATPNSLILITDGSHSKRTVFIERIVQAKLLFDCIIIVYWKTLQHIKTFGELIKHFFPTNEPKHMHFLLLIDDIDDSEISASVLNSFRAKPPNGVTVSIVAVCYTDKPERMQRSPFDYHLNITDFRVEHSTKGTSSILGEYLGHYSVAYKKLFSDSIISGFESLQLNKPVKTLTELIYLLVNSSLTKYSLSTSGNDQFDVMCLASLEAELRKQPMGSFFDISYMFKRYQLDDVALISKCRKSDKLFKNAAVQDLMTARAIKLLPLSHQIQVLTTCGISKTIYGFYGGLSCPDLCVTAFDASMSALLDIFEGMHLKQTNKIARCLLCVLNCLYQLQESSLCTRFIEKFADLFVPGVDFTGESITYLDIASMSYFVEVCSTFSTWDVAIQDSLLSEDYPGRKPSMITALKLAEYSRINRKKIGTGTNLIQRLSSHATSETLFKLLQFISPVPVVCSSKNPGYTSFVSCKCFKEPVLSRIQFDPIVPTHWVTPDSKSSRQFNALPAHHTEVHGPELLEYVILLAPLPSSVKCILPTNEDIIVHIDCEWTGATEGATEEAMRNSNETSSVGECKQEKTYDVNKAEHVFPGYILSKILNEKQ